MLHIPLTPAPEIVKLGGSLLDAPLLPALLKTLTRRGAPLVIVPGGGVMADAVRGLQPRLRLSDAACHRMAILAMEQVAHALADMEPALLTVDTPEALSDAHAQGRAVIWLPARMTFAASDLPESWDLTSDSLAAWLAGLLGAARLTLVKSVSAVPGSSAREWADAGLVDPLFPSFAARLSVPPTLSTPDLMPGMSDGTGRAEGDMAA